MTYEWESNLETGHAKIDNQHKQLFTTLNTIIEQAKRPKLSEGFIFTTLKYLINYTVVHFETEELLMEKYNYENYSDHKKIHEEFKKAALSLYNTLIKKGASEELMQQIIITVGDWLIHHIKGEDQDMAAFVKTKDIDNAWDPNLEIGDERIDDQNKKFFSELNTFILESLKPNISGDVVTRTVDFLMSYIIVHFYMEEHLMEDYGYTNISTHKKIHEDLKKFVRSINMRLISNGPADILIHKKINYIFNAILDHIKGEDQKIASFIKTGRNSGYLGLAA